MKALYYRYLFENVENGMIQAGSIYNEENDCSVNYVYLSGNPTNSNINDGVSSKDSSRTNDITGIGILDKRTIRRLAGAPIDLVVVGEYTRDCLGILYALLQNTTIQTVIMPYVAPIHRMLVEQWISEEQDMEEKALPEQWILEPEMSPEKLLEFSCLIRHPYHALKNMGVENVYLLYGNCPPCSLDAVQNARKGNYFELADAEDLETIKIMEREYIPVVKAGCIIKNKWVFYFSAYGMNVMELYQFTRRYYTKEGYDRALRHPENTQYQAGMQRLLEAYKKTYGLEAFAAVIMYAGPGQVKESGSKINGAMYEQSFGRENHCSPYLDAGRTVCMLKCIQRNDYGMLRNQFTRESRTLRMGVLFLGNIDMHKNMEEILKRYRGYGKTVRIVSIPGNEDVSKWNPEFPWKFEGEGIRYWVGNINERMDTKILKDILLAGSYNRIISVNEEYGYCLSGYMLDGEEYQQLL